MEKDKLKNESPACSNTVLGIQPSVVPTFELYPEQDRKAMQAHAKLVLIARAANQLANDNKPWQPDWNDYDQYKYYPWFDMGGSSCFRYGGYDAWTSTLTVSSRLCFKSSVLAEYAGKQFLNQYKQFMNI